MEKIYVKVRVDHHIGGVMQPLMFKEDGGAAIKIDRIIDMRLAPSLKAGGQGLRYTCQIGTTLMYLFFDQGHWFIESV